MQTLIKHKQTKPLATIEALSLPMLQVSPYYSIGRGAIVQTKMALNIFIGGLAPSSGSHLGVIGIIEDTVGPYTGTFNIPLPTGSNDVAADIIPMVNPAINAYYFANLGVNPDSITWLIDPVAGASTSYQTIVSQTGTAAPAVSGGFTPANSYGATFTWARTGVGVYTLTASTAVFNTSGKTGVFITPPQNLNGSFRAVVTSTTVITVTTAVQSLAVLGLLGFTAVNTDALLNNTMVYVQTYS